MLLYWVKCKKNTENVDPKVLKAKNGNTVLSSKCVICCSKRPWSIKDQQTKGLLSSLGIKDFQLRSHYWVKCSF